MASPLIYLHDVKRELIDNLSELCYEYSLDPLHGVISIPQLVRCFDAWTCKKMDPVTITDSYEFGRDAYRNIEITSQCPNTRVAMSFGGGCQFTWTIVDPSVPLVIFEDYNILGACFCLFHSVCLHTTHPITMKAEKVTFSQEHYDLAYKFRRCLFQRVKQGNAYKYILFMDHLVGSMLTGYEYSSKTYKEKIYNKIQKSRPNYKTYPRECNFYKRENDPNNKLLSIQTRAIDRLDPLLTSLGVKMDDIVTLTSPPIATCTVPTDKVDQTIDHISHECSDATVTINPNIISVFDENLQQQELKRVEEANKQMEDDITYIETHGTNHPRIVYE